MTAVATIALEFRAGLAAPPDRVFAALTRGEHLGGWFCDAAESEPKAGGELVLRWFPTGRIEPPYRGRWIEFDPPRFASFAGGHDGYPGGHAGRIEYTLVPDGRGTALLVHHVLPATADYDPVAERYRRTWPFALAKLTAYLTPREEEETS